MEGSSEANVYLPVTRTHTQGDAKHAAKHAAVACSGGTADVVGASAKLPACDDQIC